MADIKVQRGTKVFGASADTDTVTISAVSELSKAFVRITATGGGSSGRDGGSTANANNDDIGITCWLSDTDEISFERYASGEAQDHRFHYEVWEYTGAFGGENEFVKRMDEDVTFADTDTQIDTVISGVDDKDDCVVFIASIRSASTGRVWHDAAATAEIFDDSGVIKARVTRTDGNNECIYRIVVIEFTGSNWGVESIEHTFVAAGTNEVETIADVSDWTQAFIVSNHRGPTAITEDRSVGWNVWPGAITTQARMRIYPSSLSPTAHIVRFWVIQNAQLVVEHLDSITGGDANLSSTGSPVVDDYTITAVVLADTGLVGTNDSSSTGDPYPRPHRGNILTTTTNLQYWVTRSGDAGEFAAQVITFPTSLPGQTVIDPTGTEAEAWAGCPGLPHTCIADDLDSTQQTGATEGTEDLLEFFAVLPARAINITQVDMEARAEGKNTATNIIEFFVETETFEGSEVWNRSIIGTKVMTQDVIEDIPFTSISSPHPDGWTRWQLESMRGGYIFKDKNASGQISIKKMFFTAFHNADVITEDDDEGDDMRRTVFRGKTNVMELVFFKDATQTDGRGLTGLVFGDVTAVFYEESGGGRIAVTMATGGSLGSWVGEGRLVEVESTDIPGLYQLSLPNSMWDGTPEHLTLWLQAAGAKEIVYHYQIVAQDPNALALLQAATHTGAVIPTTSNVSNDVGITQGAADKVWGTTVRELSTTGKTGFTLTTADHTLIADALLKRDMGAVSGAASRSPLNALRPLRNKWSISGTTLTVFQENDTTPAWTATITEAPSADPISGSDPVEA